jgi:hypothetical protein
MTHLGNRGVHSVGQVEHAEGAIAEARASWINVGEGRCRIRAARNAERNLVTRNQLQATNLVLQPWIGQRLDLIEGFEVLAVGDIVEQGNGRKLGVDQTVCLQTFTFQHRKVAEHYHWAPRSASIRRNVSYSEIMSPCAMTASGERPLKNSL